MVSGGTIQNVRVIQLRAAFEAIVDHLAATTRNCVAAEITMLT